MGRVAAMASCECCARGSVAVLRAEAESVSQRGRANMHAAQRTLVLGMRPEVAKAVLARSARGGGIN